jgi:hypothetical protein
MTEKIRNRTAFLKKWKKVYNFKQLVEGNTAWWYFWWYFKNITSKNIVTMRVTAKSYIPVEAKV